MNRSRVLLRGSVLLTALLVAPTALSAQGEMELVRSTEFGEAGGEGALSGVFGVVVSADGRVFASEPRFGRVVEFASDGRFGRVVGGSGEGPGEFAYPGALFVVDGGLAVTDFTRGLTYFDPDGGFRTLVSFSIATPTSGFGIRPLFPLPGGAVAAFAPASPDRVASGSVTEQAYLRATTEGEILDTIVTVSQVGSAFDLAHDGSRQMGVPPLQSAPLFTATPDGSALVIVDREPAEGPAEHRYTVTRIDAVGDTLRTGSIGYLPQPVTRALVDSLSRGIARSWARRSNHTEATLTGVVRDGLDWPEYRPPATEVVAGSDGTVWVRREPGADGTVRWDVMGASLELEGWVVLPATTEVKHVRSGEIHVVEKDAFDVPTIVRYQVVRRDDTPPGGIAYDSGHDSKRWTR